MEGGGHQIAQRLQKFIITHLGSWLYGVYQLEQILSNSLKYNDISPNLLQHNLPINFLVFVISEQVVYIYVLSISQRGITLIERKDKVYESLNISWLVDKANSSLISEFQKYFIVTIDTFRYIHGLVPILGMPQLRDRRLIDCIMIDFVINGFSYRFWNTYGHYCTAYTSASVLRTGFCTIFFVYGWQSRPWRVPCSVVCRFGKLRAVTMYISETSQLS